MMPAAAGAAPKDDKVTGSGKIALEYGEAAKFSVTARSGPDGEDARGNINFRDVEYPGGQNATAEVVCLLVGGKTAAIVGEWKKEPAFPGWDYALIWAEDNGTPSAPTPDHGVAAGVNNPDCEAWIAFGDEATPFLHGNVTVVNAD